MANNLYNLEGCGIWISCIGKSECKVFFSSGLAPRSYTDEQYSTMVDPLDVIARIEEWGLKVAHGYEV